jgi:hypothetical protein
MFRFLIGIFIILHGLVHFWYFTLSQRLVAFQPEMGWDGSSVILSNFVREPALRSIAGVLYVLAALTFVVGGVGLFIQADWMRPVLIGAAIFSSAVILLFWDGSGEMLVQKGLLGLLINLAILLILLVFQQSGAAAA